MSVHITVLRDKFVKGWPRHECGGPAHVLDLGEALEREFLSDAHFAAYRTPNGRRLVREAISELGVIELTAIVFDVDGPGHAATAEWRDQTRQRMLRLFDVHLGGFYYETRGGARIVYAQHEPTELRTQDDCREWSQAYAVAVAYLERRFGIVADAACNDWQRLYRLPRATREPGGKPENWPTHGDASAIGPLLIDASNADVERARRVSKAFNKARSLPLATGTYQGDGLLFWLLRGRGEVGGEAPRGGWIALCPNRAQHTSNSDGTDSTVAYPPEHGHELGTIVCRHAHCDRFTNRDWLRFFDPAELERARRAAGIVRAA